jgi:hypothetical protein
MEIKIQRLGLDIFKWVQQYLNSGQIWPFWKRVWMVSSIFHWFKLFYFLTRIIPDLLNLFVRNLLAGWLFGNGLWNWLNSKPIGTIGSIAFLLAATLYQENPDRNHKLWNIRSTERYNSIKLTTTSHLKHSLNTKKTITFSLIELIYTGIVFFSYLTDFGYFTLKIVFWKLLYTVRTGQIWPFWKGM